MTDGMSEAANGVQNIQGVQINRRRGTGAQKSKREKRSGFSLLCAQSG
jgi:hypothetical protein